MYSLLFLLLVACDPVPTVPVPTENLEPDGLAAPPTPGQAAGDTDPGPVLESNRAPVITRITIEPDAPRTMDDISATVEAEDPEDDYVRFDYTWLVNEREVKGQRQRSFPHSYTTKGDLVQLKVMAKDSEHETEGLSSLIIVRNTPPEITNRTGSLSRVDGFQVQAVDIDGDKLSFSLEGAPAGMSIDRDSGTLSYQGSEDAEAGDYQVEIIVEDGDEGSARWAFGIRVSAGSGAELAEEPDEAAALEALQRRSRGWNPAQEKKAPSQEEGEDLGRDEGEDLGRDEGEDLGRDEGEDLGRDEGEDLGRDEGTDD
jgi:hypothetical protein